MRSKISVTIMILSTLFISGCNSLINHMTFHPDRGVLPAEQLPANVQDVCFKTDDGIEIHSYYLEKPSSRRILIYFHGNAGNISHRLTDLIKIHSFNINVLGVSYRGYGKSQGKPSEDGIYKDGKAALEYATRVLGYDPGNVVVLGRSIGASVAIHISQNIDLGGLILVTPLTSAKEYARATGLGWLSPLAGNSFNNIGKIGNVVCPTLVVHGNKDNVVPLDMGREVFEKSVAEKRFVEIEGAGHNDLSTTYRAMYWSPIHEFLVDSE
ncbi:MAG: alpha/beta hydrolase [Bacteroidales bacterium]|nr:alpha/beta hydrolase [Candidatus Latescibacterota bacterium]